MAVDFVALPGARPGQCKGIAFDGLRLKIVKVDDASISASQLEIWTWWGWPVHFQEPH